MQLRYVGPIILFIALLLHSSAGQAQMSLQWRAWNGDLGGDIDPSVNPRNCQNPQPSVTQPGQFDRLNQLFEEAGKTELLPTDFLQEMSIVMGDCYDGDKVDKNREKTREYIEREVGKYFSQLDPLTQAMFNPETPSDQSYKKIKDLEKREEAFLKARQKDAIENFKTVALWARSLVGEIAYKQDCSKENGSIIPHLKAASRVILNRVKLVETKKNCGVTEWNHMVRQKNSTHYVDKKYKRTLATARDILMSTSEFNVWDENDPSRFKALCPAQKAGQIQPIPLKEVQRNLEREKKRALETGEKQRPVPRYTVLGQGRFRNWQESVAAAYIAVMHPDEYVKATHEMNDCQVFYSSGQHGYDNMAKNDVVPVDGRRVRINRTPINDRSCIQLWRPMTKEERAKKNANK